ncbi:VOC family protein [Oceanobacillus salinisoli]|uniref:VOC family protein n=1 Tax=Oceanobacillus salinisoli TaxID=2678611 RepID=UPI0012E1C6BB|nr:VOC family protein [Oceanobacillus salinisoli]
MSLIDRIDTICLKVSNIEQSSKWYQEVLGFKEIFKGDNYLILGVGSSEIPLTLEKETVNHASKRNQVYPIFYTRNIEEAYKKLQKYKVKTSDIQNDGINQFLDLYDLDENRLQVCYWE